MFGCKKQPSQYEQLCHIYERYLTKPATVMNAVALAQDVERELPAVYANFDLVVNSANPDRYDVLKQMARDKGEDHWQCEAVPKYYARFMQHKAQTSSGE